MHPDTLLTNSNIITGAIFLGGIIFCIFVTIWVVIDARQKVTKARDREETRREVAAYVAEGSMTAEDAAKILAAGGSIGQRIINELGELKKIGDPRLRRNASERVVDEAFKPQTT